MNSDLPGHSTSLSGRCPIEPRSASELNRRTADSEPSPCLLRARCTQWRLQIRGQIAAIEFRCQVAAGGHCVESTMRGRWPVNATDASPLYAIAKPIAFDTAQEITVFFSCEFNANSGESDTFKRQQLVLQMILASKQIGNHPAFAALPGPR